MELRIDQVSKTYGKVTALHPITLTCQPEVIGLIGPNGAGKTTFMRILATLIPPSQGQVWWNGQATQTLGGRFRQRLGYLPQSFGIYPEFTGRQFLRYLAAMKGLPPDIAPRRVAELLEVVNLERVADRPLSGYSGGMKQRIGIAQALLNDPELLIVDEPTAGLDPEERVRFRTLLASLTGQRIIVLSTHIVSDIEAVAARLVILREGALVADTTPEALLQRAQGQVWEVTTDLATAQQLQAHHHVSALVTTPNGVHVRVASRTQPHPLAERAIPNLEDAYLLQLHPTEPPHP